MQLFYLLVLSLSLVHAQLSHVPPGWQSAHSPCAAHFVRMRMTSDAVSLVWSIGGLGNFLSDYWNGRALAAMSGVCFESTMLNASADSWLKHLPSRVCETGTWDPAKMADRHKSVCANCEMAGQSGMPLPHKCAGWWTYYAETIQKETQAALRKWADSTGDHIKLPAFRPSDVVVYDRCEEGDSIFAHALYGPAGWSLYDSIVCGEDCTLTIVCIPQTEHGACLSKRTALLEHLYRKYPHAHIQQSCTHTRCLSEKHDISGATDAFDSFARIVFAPHLYADLSTFALWGGLANAGQVRMPAEGSFIYSNFTVPGFHWTNTSSLVGPQPRMLTGKHLNRLTMVEWLRNH